MLAGVGVANSIVFYTTSNDFERAQSDLDPATNPAWQVQPELSFASLPTGVSPAGSLPITACGIPWTGILIETDVGTDLEEFTLSFVGKTC